MPGPFQVRVLNEKIDLDGRLDRLHTFLKGSIFQTLEAAEQLRLTRQARIMEEYSSILAERIENFKDEPKPLLL